MKVLFIGDVFGKGGRTAVKKNLENILAEEEIELVICNGENVSHGKGIIPKHYYELMEYGVDFFTMGNHTFAKKEGWPILEHEENIVRPYNIDSKYPGVGTRVIDVNGTKVRITNLMGRVYIHELEPTNPFLALDEILKDTKETIHIVDMHAEATAEKQALAYNFDGKVSAVLGTHTHIQTSDERILPGGTGYITDVGMSGSWNSIIGSKRDSVIEMFRTDKPARYEAEDKSDLFCAVLLDIDEKTGKCTKIKRINIHP